MIKAIIVSRIATLTTGNLDGSWIWLQIRIAAARNIIIMN
jgi:hypothetical protein